jgi:hypothetical protein
MIKYIHPVSTRLRARVGGFACHLVCWLGLAACVANRNDAGLESGPEAAVQEQGFHGHRPPAPPTVTFDLPALERVDAGGTLGFRLESHLDSACTAVISARASSEQGQRDLPDFTQVLLEARGQADVLMSVGSLRLPHAGLQMAGLIGFSADIVCKDGPQIRVSSDRLFFEPVEDSFEFYDARTRETRPGQGMLTAEMREFAARMPRRVMLTPSYGRTAEEAQASAERDGSNALSTELPEVVAQDEEALLKRAAEILGHSTLPGQGTPGSDSKVPLQDGISVYANDVTASLCASMQVEYVDVGGGEDHYTEPGITARRVIGMVYEVYELPAWNFVQIGRMGDGFNGTTQGCTPRMTLKQGTTYAVGLYTLGIIANNPIIVTDARVGNEAWSAWLLSAWPPAADTVATVLETDTAMNVYQALAFALSLNPGRITFNDYKPFAVKDGVSTGANCPGGTFDRTATRKKFIIGHELGHVIHDVSGGGCSASFAVDYSDSSGAPCDSPGGTHNSRSREWQSAAAAEGFASFYSASTWNSAFARAGCAFHDGGSWIGCKSGNTSLPDAWYETKCPFVNNGWGANETDSLRQYWDTRTGGSSTATMNQMLKWIDDANATTAWTRTNHFTLLNAQANAASQVSALRNNWNTHKVVNQVDGVMP